MDLPARTAAAGENVGARYSVGRRANLRAVRTRKLVCERSVYAHSSVPHDVRREVKLDKQEGLPTVQHLSICNTAALNTTQAARGDKRPR